MAIKYHSTNNPNLKVSFAEALLEGQPKDYGLYMAERKEVPELTSEQITKMSEMSYAEIAFCVINPFLSGEISEGELKSLLNDAYSEKVIPTKVQKVDDKTSIMWLTQGPTYSFKDYAARFFGRTLNYFLGKKGLRRTVVVATSGDTGGAVADALHGLERVDNIVFFPKGAVSSGQRKQMTTLQGNVYAFEVNGDFDVCQALAKRLLGDKEFAEKVFGDKERLTSANSISIGRLLPQMVYPFYAYSRVAQNGERIVTSIPSGNFGDMMGTVLAKEMGLPISKIICGVNENIEFPDFLKTEKYEVNASKKSPSSAMIVSHPSNLARLIDFYQGHMFDKRDEKGKVVQEGVINKQPNLDGMRKDIFSIGVNNPEHFETMKKVFEEFGVVLDPHGAVGWKALERFREQNGNEKAVIYETADPGKFPEDVEKAIGKTPEVPEGMRKQAGLPERVFSIDNPPLVADNGALKLSDAQLEEAKEKIKLIFGKG